MMTTGVPLQHNWYPHFFLSLFVWAALVPVGPAFPLQNSSPLYQFDGQVRLRHLYTADEQTHLLLEITPDGTVRGSRYQNPYSEYL